MQYDWTNPDGLWKVRPIVDGLTNALLELKNEKRCAVDEQMIPFRGKLSFEQYMSGKPSPWGIKSCVLCGESGSPCAMIVYQGATTKLPESYSQLGMGVSVVMSLGTTALSQFDGYRPFLDNFFTLLLV